MAPQPPQCHATHNPGVWPYTSRCNRLEPNHGPMHEDKNGRQWTGKFEAENDRPGPVRPFHFQVKDEAGEISWKAVSVLNGTVICKGPRKFRSMEEAQASMGFFVEVVGGTSR